MNRQKKKAGVIKSAVHRKAYLTGKGLTATTRNHSQIEKVKISAFAARKLEFCSQLRV